VVTLNDDSFANGVLVDAQIVSSEGQILASTDIADGRVLRVSGPPTASSFALLIIPRAPTTGSLRVSR
jgi:hypothetical protein